MEAADFWNDAAQSTAKMKELKSLKDDVSVFSHLQELKEEIETYITLGYEENDPELIPEIDQMRKMIRSYYRKLHLCYRNLMEHWKICA